MRGKICKFLENCKWILRWAQWRSDLWAHPRCGYSQNFSHCDGNRAPGAPAGSGSVEVWEWGPRTCILTDLAVPVYGPHLEYLCLKGHHIVITTKHKLILQLSVKFCIHEGKINFIRVFQSLTFLERAEGLGAQMLAPTVVFKRPGVVFSLHFTTGSPGLLICEQKLSLPLLHLGKTLVVGPFNGMDSSVSISPF